MLTYADVIDDLTNIINFYAAQTRIPGNVLASKADLFSEGRLIVLEQLRAHADMCRSLFIFTCSSKIRTRLGNIRRKEMRHAGLLQDYQIDISEELHASEIQAETVLTKMVSEEEADQFFSTLSDEALDVLFMFVHPPVELRDQVYADHLAEAVEKRFYARLRISYFRIADFLDMRVSHVKSCIAEIRYAARKIFGNSLSASQVRCLLIYRG